jgi:hypothetical protein
VDFYEGSRVSLIPAILLGQLDVKLDFAALFCALHSLRFTRLSLFGVEGISSGLAAIQGGIYAVAGFTP